MGGDNRRGSIPNAILHEDLFSIAMQCSKEHIDPQLINWADLIWVMHNPKHSWSKVEQEWLVGNWSLFKNKRTIWRSIGQSIPVIEEELLPYKQQGLQIVRYSPKERNIPNYAGEDAIIRFYQDSEEYKDWNGKEKKIINFTQSLKIRGDHCGYDTFMKATEGFKRVVYGPGNEDLGDLWGGSIPYEDHKRELRDSRVYFYYGTAPASYTLSLIEALLTGIPVVAAGSGFTRHLYNQDTNEIEDIIENGKNGFVSNDIGELRKYIQLLMDNEEEARRIGEEGRKTAIAMFSKQKIMDEWRNFLEV